MGRRCSENGVLQTWVLDGVPGGWWSQVVGRTQVVTVYHVIEHLVVRDASSLSLNQYN